MVDVNSEDEICLPQYSVQ